MNISLPVNKLRPGLLNSEASNNKSLQYIFPEQSWPKTLCQPIKLDGVGPVDNRPSTNKLHHYIEKKKK